MKKRLLFFSNLYPNPTVPNQATFNYQQVQSLSTWFDVSVLSPIPWQSHGKLTAKISQWGDNSPIYPTYWYIPVFFRHLYGWMMLASVFSRAQEMYHNKKFDLILGAWLYPDGWVATRLAKRWGIPCYLKVHGTDVNRLLPGSALTAASLQAAKAANGIFCVSQALASRLIKLGVSADKCHVIYNGVDSQTFYARDKNESRQGLGLPLGDRLILYVGNLLETKGLGELMTAFTRLAMVDLSLRMIIVGSGPWEKALRGKIRQDKMTERVYLAGSISHKEIGVWMNSADVLCLPSYMEGLPNVVLEALACNTPVVATSVGGIPELANTYGRILLAEPKDATSLHSALELALKNELPQGKRMAILSWQENADGLAAIMLGS